MTELSFGASFESFTLSGASLAWDQRYGLAHGVDEPGTYPLAGEVRNLVTSGSPHEHLFPLAALREVRVRHPWPSIEIAWGDDRVLRRMHLHPRGLSRLVPATETARWEFERFEGLVEGFVAHVERMRPPAMRMLDRGWLDDDVIDWTRRPSMPEERKHGATYRDAAPHDVLLARAVVERSLATRLRIALRRGKSAHHHPAPVELAISEREIWIVDEDGAYWAVPRRALRAIYTDDERLACIFGRSSFLAMSIRQSPIRAMLVEIAERVIAQNEALR